MCFNRCSPAISRVGKPARPLLIVIKPRTPHQTEPDYEFVCVSFFGLPRRFAGSVADCGEGALNGIGGSDGLPGPW
jgi:hypothetical protein